MADATHIFAGLDYCYGHAVGILLSGHDTRPSLEQAKAALLISIKSKLSHKHPSVNRACYEYRSALNGNAPDLVLDTLNIVEGYSAAVGARKLEERLRRALYETRQLRIPGT